MKAIIVACILSVSTITSAYAGAPFDRTDKKLLVAYSVFHVIDWGQTRTIAMHPEHWHEVNPILGAHPSIGRVNAYFIATYAGNLLLARILPDKWRKLYLTGATMIEFGFAAHNASIGLHVSW